MGATNKKLKVPAMGKNLGPTRSIFDSQETTARKDRTNQLALAKAIFKQQGISVPAMGSKKGAAAVALNVIGKALKGAGTSQNQKDETGPQFAPHEKWTDKERDSWSGSKEDAVALVKRKSSKNASLRNYANAAPRDLAASIPRMGPVGAAAGAYVGKAIGSKIGKFIGSAGRLIGPKHREYGEKAGDYIGSGLGASIGGTLGLGAVPF